MGNKNKQNDWEYTNWFLQFNECKFNRLCNK